MSNTILDSDILTNKTIKENMNNKRLSKKQQDVDDIFKPNNNGISEWKTREELKGTPLELTNNGNCRHGVFYGDNRYIWEVQRKSNAKTSMVVAIRLNGFSDEQMTSNRPISKKIRNEILHEDAACVNCGNTSNLVVDHKK